MTSKHGGGSAWRRRVHSSRLGRTPFGLPVTFGVAIVVLGAGAFGITSATQDSGSGSGGTAYAVQAQGSTNGSDPSPGSTSAGSSAGAGASGSDSAGPAGAAGVAGVPGGATGGASATSSDGSAITPSGAGGTYAPTTGGSGSGATSGPTAGGGSTGPTYTLAFSDDFNGSSLDASKWSKYNGQPKSTSSGYWLPSHVLVGGGLLTLRTSYDAVMGRYVSGGISNAKAATGTQRYGKYEIRFRTDAGNGVGYVALLYPAGGGWPPEIDFTEDGGGPRTSSMATLHYGTNNTQIHRFVSADFTQWHTIGVIWEPGKLSYTLDGHVYATIQNPNVSSVPMWLGLQAEQKDCKPGYPLTCRDANTPAIVDFQVDWVKVYSYTP